MTGDKTIQKKIHMKESIKIKQCTIFFNFSDASLTHIKLFHQILCYILIGTSESKVNNCSLKQLLSLD